MADGLSLEARMEYSIEDIGEIISNPHLASAVLESVDYALNSADVQMIPAGNAQDCFRLVLEQSIRDIENHAKGDLLRRLLEFGPLDADAPLGADASADANTTERTILNDAEVSACIAFVHSHCINAFKGAVAELLALRPCIKLTQKLIAHSILPAGCQLFWGDAIAQRTLGSRCRPEKNFVKGADGLLLSLTDKHVATAVPGVEVHGIVEVKSMYVAPGKLAQQIGKHRARLAQGVKLSGRIWPPEQVRLAGPVEIRILPDNWPVNRNWRFEAEGDKRVLVLPEPDSPAAPDSIERIGEKVWRITLAWSVEALEQAAYEMTYWYMSEIGEYIYSRKQLPEDWVEMTPAEAGYNAIRMMLYYVLLRYSPRDSKRRLAEEQLAIKLYNIYCFGYALGVDSKEMLWPEDFKDDCD
jgi:hypothetical protein